MKPTNSNSKIGAEYEEFFGDLELTPKPYGGEF